MSVSLAEGELACVVQQCDFAYMKSIGAKFNVGAAPWVQGKGTMIRKGQHGSSGELLTRAEQRLIDTHMQAELQRLGSDFLYAEFCDVTP